MTEMVPLHGSAYVPQSYRDAVGTTIHALYAITTPCFGQPRLELVFEAILSLSLVLRLAPFGP